MRGLFEVHELISSEAITGSSLFEGASYSRKYGIYYILFLVLFQTVWMKSLEKELIKTIFYLLKTMQSKMLRSKRLKRKDKKANE